MNASTGASGGRESRHSGPRQPSSRHTGPRQPSSTLNQLHEAQNWVALHVPTGRERECKVSIFAKPIWRADATGRNSRAASRYRLIIPHPAGRYPQGSGRGTKREGRRPGSGEAANWLLGGVKVTTMLPHKPSESSGFGQDWSPIGVRTGGLTVPPGR